MPTVLITGANRGLGFEFVRQYAGEGWRVIAAVRDPAAALELKQVGGQIDVRNLDLSDLARADWSGAIGSEPLDLVISNAGRWGLQSIDSADGIDSWREEFAINSIAPTLLALHAKPNLKAAGGTAVAVTSRMGSIADNDSGGSIPYRSSKAALNAAWKSLSVELARDGIASAVLHPGWVQTRMGGPGAPLQPPESVAGMRRVIAGLTVGAFGFYNYDGAAIPW